MLSLLGDPGVYPLALALAAWLSWRRPTRLAPRNLLVLILGYPLVSMLLVPVLKSSLDFPRPITVLGGQAVHLIGDPMAGHAFPSGHAAFVVLLACALAPDSPPRLRWALTAFAVLVSASRVSSGAHFPADVLGGALIAAAVAAALHRALANRLQ